MLAKLWPTIKDYGWGWTSARLAYELQVRSGLKALRFSQRPWMENELSARLSPGVPSAPDEYRAYWRQNKPNFFFNSERRSEYAPALARVLGEQGIETLVKQAERLREGYLTYFFSQSALVGLPPDWHSNPFTGQYTSPVDHWSRIPVFSAKGGDLKFIWEPGRFAFAYALVRAYWATGDDAHAETFWQFVESWASSNPPNHGAHWKCGQEISLRLMAWCFALHAFADSAATTAKRLALLAGMIAVQADRVAGDHIYAKLQRNNHSITEGTGLWTVGLLFPEFERSDQWRAYGREILEREALSQIAIDGSYVQNSKNYHRFMLHDYIWSIRLGEVCSDSLQDSTLQRVERAVEFLYQVQDSESGQVPCYGHNDGALALPLNSCDYTDFRPAVSAGNYLFQRSRLYEAGPWEEDLLWLFGPDALGAPVQVERRSSLAAHEGGYYTLRGERSYGFTRCTTYHHRPGQADMLHLDLWWHGVNVACDPGSYFYYADPPWNNNLTGTNVHNTVSVGEQDQMVRGPRFMWFNRVKSEVLAFERSSDGNLEWFQGQHYGYLRLPQPVVHRRAVLRAGDNVWLVVDDLLGEGSQDVASHWLLHPGEYVLDQKRGRLSLSLPVGEVQLYWNAWGFEEMGVDISCGDETKAPRGWRSRYYGMREPALSFRLAGRGQLPCRLVSVFVLGGRDQEILFDDKSVVVSAKEQTLWVTLSALKSDRLSIREAKLSHDGMIENLKVTS